MKKIMYLIILTFILPGCEKSSESIDYDKIELQPFIIENYFNDARQLYFDEVLHDSSHVNFNNPAINYIEIDKVLKIIQAVYNSDSPERDTVFDIYQIHAYYCYSFSAITLNVKTDLLEIENLSNGVIPTGETYMDNILNTYNFDSVKTFYSYPDFPWLTIYTQDEYNLIPIEKEFDDLESVLIADFNKACIGDGNTISLIRDNSSATITFSIGQGDCPAGCIYHKYWEFEVSNGVAKFVKAYEN